MRCSAQTKEIYSALVAFQSECQNVGFDKENPHFRSKYTSLAAQCDAVRDLAAKHGLAIVAMPAVRCESGMTYRVVCTRIVHTSGQWLEEEMQLTGKEDPQGQGSAITYARRYTLPGIGLFASSDNVDDDGEAAKLPTMTPELLKSTLAFIPMLCTKEEVIRYKNELASTFDIPDGTPAKVQIKAALAKRHSELSEMEKAG